MVGGGREHLIQFFLIAENIEIQEKIISVPNSLNNFPLV